MTTIFFKFAEVNAREMFRKFLSRKFMVADRNFFRSQKFMPAKDNHAKDNHAKDNHAKDNADGR